MADTQKPVVVDAPVVVEPVAAPTVEEVKAAEPANESTKVEEAKAGEAPAATEEKKEEKPVEPIYSGSLGYKAPGLKNAFRFSKKYFWFGEETAVEHTSLTEYLRGEKPDVAHPTAAWSSQTGKGLLYFAKHADKKDTPAGVLKLADATELTKDGMVAFHFKLHGHKHSFESSTTAERNGWYLAFEKEIEGAKENEKAIVESDGYKEHLEKLKKPTTLAAPASATAPKKSAEVPAKSTETAEQSAITPARTGSSSSSSSSDADKKKKKSKSKSRSVSRGKRTSFFGGLMGKKDEVKEKHEEKKEEQKDEKKEEKMDTSEANAAAITPIAPIAEASTAPTEPVNPVIPLQDETSNPPATKLEEVVSTDAAADVKTEEKKPKVTKRGSIFGAFAQRLKSPTTEKKESDVLPVVPSKDAEAPVEAPKTEETVVAPVAPVIDTKIEETKPVSATTPHKERENFFGKFLAKKSPTAETAPKLEETPKEASTTEATPAPAVQAVEAPKEEDKKDDGALGVTSTATAAPAPKAKRGSIFGNFGGSVKKDGEEKKGGLGGLFRNASKSIKPKKEKEAAAGPSKLDETTESKEAIKAEDAPKEEAASEKKTAEPAAIGDVVPEAVTVGQAPKSTPEVSATA